MKHKKSSLTTQFCWLLMLSAAVSGLLFCTLYFGGGTLLTNYFEKTNFQERLTEKRILNLQEYVQKNNLSAFNAVELTGWTKKEPLILMEIYRANVLIYTSSVPEELYNGQNDALSPYYEWVSYYQVQFSDGPAEVVVYANDTYRWFTNLVIGSMVLSFVTFLFVFLWGIRGLVRYICELSVQIGAMEGGDLDVPITQKGNHELSDLAKSLDSMRRAFKEQREQETSIFRANQTMITEMSHDLRTPLTALQIYMDILRYKKYDPKQLDGYLEKMDAKTSQIKQISDNIFEYALVSRQQEVKLDAPESFREVFHDILSEAVAYLSSQGFTFDIELEWPIVEISVYPLYIRRLIDNAASNIIKYADPNYPVRLEEFNREESAGLIIKNRISSAPAEQDSTHIGIANMQTMMEKMNGTCQIEKTDTDFAVKFVFPITAPEKCRPNGQ